MKPITDTPYLARRFTTVNYPANTGQKERARTPCESEIHVRLLLRFSVSSTGSCPITESSTPFGQSIPLWNDAPFRAACLSELVSGFRQSKSGQQPHATDGRTLNSKNPSALRDAFQAPFFSKVSHC